VKGGLLLGLLGGLLLLLGWVLTAQQDWLERRLQRLMR
jgi:hypothetical protein